MRMKNEMGVATGKEKMSNDIALSENKKQYNQTSTYNFGKQPTNDYIHFHKNH